MVISFFQDKSPPDMGSPERNHSMGDQDKIIEALERMKALILEVQSKFSEAADIFSRRRAYDLTQMPEAGDIIKNIEHKPNDGNTEEKSEYDKLLKAGDYLKSTITNAQIEFLRAVSVVSTKPVQNLTEEQLNKIQQEIIQATIDIVKYRELLRRLFETLGIPNPYGPN